MAGDCIVEVDVTVGTFVIDVTTAATLIEADCIFPPVLEAIDVNEVGPQGPVGPAGVPGPPGPQGVPGPSGSAIVGIEFVIDGGGAAISTGIKGDLGIPFACVLNEAVLVADQVGNAVVDVWKSTFPAFPPSVANSITGATPPTLASALKADDATLVGWTTAINAGDILRYNVASASAVQKLTLSLKATRS